MTVKKPSKKTPPAKSPVMPVFEPVHVVLYTEGVPTFKLILKTQDEVDVFMGERKDEIELDPEKIQTVTEEEFELIELVNIKDENYADDNSTELILDKSPEPEFNEDNLPARIIVENKKSGVRFTVNRKYFLANRGELKLV